MQGGKLQYVDILTTCSFIELLRTITPCDFNVVFVVHGNIFEAHILNKL